MYAGKPIIGIAGGIGSGKTLVARLFEEFGGLVISSDDQVREAYRDPLVQEKLRKWWGDQALDRDGEINRSFIAAKVFNDAGERRRLEELIHPLVHEARQRAMAQAASDPKIIAFIWDTPLLFETGLNEQCDAVVFVDTPPEIRQRRVRESRGWEAGELARRENSQWPLDKKRRIADYVVSNTADVGFVHVQVKDVLSRILTKAKSL